jgi:uncharacterized protein YjbJ (UPF0337 family)
MINSIEVNGAWNEQKGKLKQRFAGKLQVKLGKTKEELAAIISSL